MMQENRLHFLKFCLNELRARGLRKSTGALLRLSSAKARTSQVLDKPLNSQKKHVARLLFIDFRVPMPDKDAGSLTAILLMDILQSLGFKIIFYPTNKSYVENYYEDLLSKGIEILTPPETISLAFWLKEHGSTIDYVWASRGPELNAYFEIIRRYCQNAKVIFYTVDIHYIRLVREARLRKSKLLMNESRRLKKIEINLARKSDATIVLSEYELQVIKANHVYAPCLVLPLIYRDIPGSNKGFGDRSDILFIGGFDHPPNVDAVIYFANEILPTINKHLPDIKLRIVGSNPPEQIMLLASRPNIEVLGYVKDLTKELENSRISIAPLRFGAGLKGKVGLSMCYGLPCVATGVASEGMHLESGKEILIADDAASLANQVLRIYQDQILWDLISKNSFNYAKQNFSLNQASKKIKSLINLINMQK
jgi:glycosyltransferase involved in cell wall biosynthesis